jgi:hypothetical protein
MLAKILGGFREVGALAGAVHHKVFRGAIALAGNLSLAIRQQLDIASKYNRHGFLDAAVAGR